MTNQHDPNCPGDHATHYYVTPAVLPRPDDTDTEWIQRVTMLGELSEQLMKTIYTYLRINAPILITEDQPLWHLIAGVGLLMRGVHTTGSNQLAKRGEQPLDVNDDQASIIRDELAQPNLNPELRDALLTILSNLLNAPAKPMDTEWPAGGFVIGGEES